MRRDPTIKLARLMVRAPIMATGWTVECDTPGLRELADIVSSMVMPLRFRFLESATAGLIDFGWQSYEKVYEISGGLYSLRKLKPLLQDFTTLMIDTDTGEITGLKNDPGEGTAVELSKVRIAVFNLDAECDNHYGQSYMASAERPYDASVKISKSAEVYDRKIAGAHWIIHYPAGKALYNGVETNNEEIAKDLINKLEGSGSFAIPIHVNDLIEGLNASSQYESAWRVELLEASGSGANFEERLSRCDINLVRAFGLPERAILEGHFGTKAEADSHGDFAITGIELLHQSIVSQFNDWVTNSLVRINFGESFVNKIYVTANPLTDMDRAFFRRLYELFLQSPEGAVTELASLDMASIRDRLNIPYTEA